jgi:NADPH:quinone reductase-like Zn-dependent oxidoreductase
MQAVLCTHFGGPDELELAQLPEPQPGASEVVVAVKAASRISSIRSLLRANIN